MDRKNEIRMLVLYSAGFWLFFCQVTPNTLGSGYTKGAAFFYVRIFQLKGTAEYTPEKP